MSYYGYQWPKYVPVAERRRKARRKMDQLRKKGIDIQPIEIEGRKIAKTFWGKAWCDHMESLSDFENRLPRGRTYVRNGSVCHLEIKKGRVSALVSGSALYKIDVKISTLPKVKWNRIKRRCVGQIGSLIELLQGSLSAGVMQVVTDPAEGLFPCASEIHLSCNCPDWAYLCKHMAAVLYGVGARLDERPELLFLLRGVRHDELIDGHLDKAVADTTRRSSRRRTVAPDDLASVFEIDLEEAHVVESSIEERGSRNRGKKMPKQIRTAAKTRPQKKKQASLTRKKAAKKKVANKKKAVAKKRPATRKGPKKKSSRKKSTSQTVAKNKSAKSATKRKSTSSEARKQTPMNRSKKAVSKTTK